MPYLQIRPNPVKAHTLIPLLQNGTTDPERHRQHPERRMLVFAEIRSGLTLEPALFDPDRRALLYATRCRLSVMPGIAEMPEFNSGHVAIPLSLGSRVMRSAYSKHIWRRIASASISRVPEGLL